MMTAATHHVDAIVVAMVVRKLVNHCHAMILFAGIVTTIISVVAAQTTMMTAAVQSSLGRLVG